jgi:hypothetical protein
MPVHVICDMWCHVPCPPVVVWESSWRIKERSVYSISITSSQRGALYRGLHQTTQCVYHHRMVFTRKFIWCITWSFHTYQCKGQPQHHNNAATSRKHACHRTGIEKRERQPRCELLYVLCCGLLRMFRGSAIFHIFVCLVNDRSCYGYCTRYELFT